MVCSCVGEKHDGGPDTSVRSFLASLRVELSVRHCRRRDPVFRRSSAICRFAASLAVIVAVSVSHGTDLHAKDKSRTPVASSIKGLTVSPEELRVRVRALIRPTLGIIEQGADGIIASTSDPAVRRGALILKIETTTTMLAAMLRSDPVAALADAWGYLMQVENLLAGPEAEARFGQSARRASETLQLAEVQFRNLVASVQRGRFAESFPAYLRRWADGHPIEGGLSRRPSIDDALAELLASSGAEGVFAQLGDLDEMMPDVMKRMDVYTMYLPRLARWEAELAADDLTRGVDTRMLTAEFERLTRAVDRMATVAETASDLAARERTAVLEAVRNERVAIFGEVKNERVATLHEVEAMMQRLLKNERVATLREAEAIAQRLTDRSSGPLRDAFVTEVGEVLKRTEEMRKRLIAESGQALDGVVDHAFFRLIELLLVCAALVGLGVLLRQQRRAKAARGKGISQG